MSNISAHAFENTVYIDGEFDKKTPEGLLALLQWDYGQRVFSTICDTLNRTGGFSMNENDGLHAFFFQSCHKDRMRDWEVNFVRHLKASGVALHGIDYEVFERVWSLLQ